MCELVKLLFIISVVCSKFYAINRNFTRPPVPSVPTNMMSVVHTRVFLDYEIVHYAVYFTMNQNVDKEKRSNQDNQWDI